MIIACELMVAALRNPEKYEGRRYEAECALVDSKGNSYKNLYVDDGKLVFCQNEWAYINSNTVLTELPRKVGFLMATKSERLVKPFDPRVSEYHSMMHWYCVLSEMPPTAAKEMVNDYWLIQGDDRINE